MRRFHTILDAKAATGIDYPMQVSDYNKFMLAFDSASSANMTVKFQGSLSEDMPDFAASQTKDNQWDYIDVIDLEDGTPIDGDTGIVLSGTDNNLQLQANVDALEWICAIVTARSAGSITLKAAAYNHNFL